MLLGLLASVAVLFLWQELIANEQLHIEQLIEQQANAIKSQISEELSIRMVALQQMANRWEVSGATPQDLWEADAEAYVKDFYGCQALEWVDPSFKVRWVVPLIGNEAVKNLDLSQEPRRQITLQVARDLRQIILTRKIALAQGGKGFLATVPLFVGERFDGFILGVFRFQSLFHTILKVPVGYNVAIYDGAELIYSQGNTSQSFPHKTVVVKTYGADWRLEVSPTPELLEQVKSPVLNVVLIGGLALVWMLVLIVYLTQISYRQIHQFKKANRQLEREIHQRQQAEIEIARLAAIVESSEDAIFSKDLDNVITSWNRGAERIFGYTAAEIIGQRATKLISAEYQDEENNNIRRIQQGERIKHYETKRLRKDAALIDISITVSPIKDENGNIIGASKIARNISDRKQAEEALRQSEERWELALRGNNDGIWDWNIQSNEVFFSSRWKEMLGYQEHEIQNTLDEWTNRIHPDDLEWVMEAVQDHFAKKTPFYLTEHRIRCKDGSYKWILDRAQALWDDKGKVIRMAGSHTDITERKQTEVAIKESEARYRQLIDNLTAGFVIHAIDTSIILCNSKACELLGLSMDQILGKTTFDQSWHFLREDGTVMPKEEYPVNQVLSSNIPLKNYVLGINRGIDPLIWVLVNAYPEFDTNNQCKQVVITFIDISKLKQAESEIQQTRNFLQALLNHLPVAIVVKDAHPERFGVFQFWNKTSEVLFGISAEQATGKTCYDFFPTEQANFFDQKDRETVSKGSVEDIPEKVIDSHSLGQRWLHTIKIPIYNEQNQPDYLLEFSEDITARKQAETELREMSKAVENAVSGISKLDTQGCYLFVNKAYADLTGYQPEEMLGMAWQKTVHPDELDKLIAAYGQMVEQGRVEVETTGVRKDNSIFYKQLVMISTYDEQHQFIGHYCFMKDITERKITEVALAQELLRTKTLFHTSMDGIVVMDAKGKVVEASPSFAQMLGYTLEETVNLSVFDWDAQWSKEELELILNEQQTFPLFETRHRRKDGFIYDVEISWSRVTLEGKVMNLCICRDISGRKQTEEALRHQKEMFQTIVSHIPVMIALFNPEGIIEFINPELERILGWSLEDWKQKDILEECYPDPVYRQSVLEHMLSATGKWKDATTLTATKQSLETSWANVRLSSGYLLGIGQDITERKQKERALQQAMEAAEAANLAKSIFLANMSHELRTPLNVILGFAQVMAHDSALTPSQQEDLLTIRRSGDHLLNLINDVLDISKIESGHCTIEESPFDLIALLHSLRNMFAERASSKGLDISLEISPDVPQYILADAQKLRQVLLNLLSNAIKFTSRGSITVGVSVAVDDKKTTPITQSILRFVVADTGVGIAVEELDTIFDAFVQAQAGKRSANGTGLGLTISRKLVELMGGQISVSTTLGVGTQFSFTVPVTPTSGVNITPEENDRLVIGLAPGQPHHRILVVDDRLENRRLIARLLGQLGLEVKEATNGREAVKIWQEWLPDLTWMDIRMPVLDGYEATKQIRAMEHGQNGIIIALTAQASQSDRALALAAGCNDYISKPFREQTVFFKMSEYLGLKYIYEEETMAGQGRGHNSSPSLSSLSTPASSCFDPALLATLSSAWLTQLEKAAVCGDDVLIIDLVAELSPEFSSLATELVEFANQYQFEEILKLIQDNFPTRVSSSNS
ncbi:PAS domain S-box protein [Ancylothrix sp. C2]|nr:PAS domain S-box protein [Ancylothrix sp. D3o]